jgi:serine/threonine protein kinase
MPSLEPGRRFADRYVLQGRLGDGGHAEVWAAADELEHRRVALKFLHAQICDADEAWLFLSHEAEMAQRLDHPGVLRIEGPQRDGHTVFLQMECAGGGDISQLRGQSWEKLLPILRDVAQILEHAHSRGVVHRDIKPGNVLFDTSGIVRLTDFGTASRTGSAAAPATGSPFSASPQQLRGEPATTADDVYGLGALAYELLSGHPPYYPDFDPQRVLHQMPALLRPAQPAPEALIEFVMAMLAREPEDRPDLGHVMQAFEHLLAAARAAPGHSGSPGIQTPQPTPTFAVKRVRIFGVPSMLWLGIAAIVIVAGCVISLLLDAL